ncbi:DUF4372 domain-containing protein [Phocaeicola coprocola]|uniref:DUF4372 domain-containing protein n=1 Tax=Phocaeicola coprocola TaxID=310298 RepID=UPI0020CAD96E|nr:DUF4372 domain-containing protein [Phocaeicola coprocola]
MIKLLDKSTILRLSREYGGEHYVKRFDIWTHLVVMLYAVIMCFSSSGNNALLAGFCLQGGFGQGLRITK